MLYSFRFLHFFRRFLAPLLIHATEEPDDDNMEEIDTSNILTDGRRTRGRTIDYAKAEENAKAAGEPMGEDEDDDEDEDEDFVGEDDADKMEE